MDESSCSSAKDWKVPGAQPTEHTGEGMGGEGKGKEEGSLAAHVHS